MISKTPAPLVALLLLGVSACDSTALNLEGSENLDSQESLQETVALVEQRGNPPHAGDIEQTPQSTDEEDVVSVDPEVPADLTTSPAGSPLQQLCQTHPTFTNTGEYQGVLTQPLNDVTRCEYDVTLQFDTPSEYLEEFGLCVQIAEISAIGTQLISDGYDCYNLQAEELSLLWALEPQYTRDLNGSVSIRESFVYPATAETNALAIYNTIEVPLFNESGVRYQIPPGLIRLFLDEDLKYTALEFDGELSKAGSE